ncbi:glycosyltransferase [Streptomyces californicus]|uniref:glycosyltransferase n=1 Tax=Streptomyces californicus TaxID=67351 RepID=UPI0036518A1F
MKPRLSIIVPVYNVASYLRNCVNSILSQTFGDFELILVNDGSNDDSGAICDEFVKIDRRVTVIHKENGGVSSARNAGIRIAKGDFIGFIDSDDFIHEKMYEVLYQTAIEQSSDIVVCDFEKVEPNQRLSTRESIEQCTLKSFSNIDALNQLFHFNSNDVRTGAGNNVKWVVLWNKIFKRELFKSIIFEEGRICEDELIIHKLLFNSTKTTYISQKFYYYVQRPNSIIRSSFSLNKFNDKVYALKNRSDYFLNIHEEELHYKAYISYMESFIWNYYLAKAELSNVDQEIVRLKNEFNKSWMCLLRNPLIGIKQKVAIMAFIINPLIYELWIF